MIAYWFLCLSASAGLALIAAGLVPTVMKQRGRANPGLVIAGLLWQAATFGMFGWRESSVWGWVVSGGFLGLTLVYAIQKLLTRGGPKKRKQKLPI